MKSIVKSLIIAVFLVRISNGAYAQLSDYRYSSIKIITPVTIARNNQMNFETGVLLASAGNTKNMKSWSRKGTEHVFTSLPIRDTKPVASFTVSGEPYFAYTVTLPDSYAITKGQHTANIHIYVTPLSSLSILGSDGAQTLYVGATLNTAMPASETYIRSVSIPVTVNYN